MAFARADLMLRTRPGTDQQAVGQLLADAAAAFRSRAGATTAVRIAVPVNAAGSTASVPAAGGQANAASRFDAVVSAGSPTASVPELASALRTALSGVSGLFDATASCAVSGTVTVIMPGEGPYVTLYPLRRIASMSSPEFHDYWLSRHGALARTVPGLIGYRQFHGDPFRDRGTHGAARAWRQRLRRQRRGQAAVRRRGSDQAQS